MRTRAINNRSFIYIKVPGANHCLSYRGTKLRNIEDLSQFVFKLPTLEYRNKTWTTFEILEAIKKDVIRAVLSNTANLVKEKFFSGSSNALPTVPYPPSYNIEIEKPPSNNLLEKHQRSKSENSKKSESSMKSLKQKFKNFIRKKSSSNNSSEKDPHSEDEDEE
jgi:hypothetical protein